MSGQEIVKNGMLEIFRKNGYRDLSRLTQRDYDHVSHEIEKVTSILISTSTIKRLIKGDFTRSPQVATLNAISMYLGYENWQEYASSVNVDQKNAAPSTSPLPAVEAHKLKSVPLLRYTVVTLGVFLVGAAIFIVFLQFAQKDPLRNFDSATFSAQKTTANEIPNTVVFSYNVDDVAADSFFIQQSWDRHRRVRVFKNNYTLTDIYYEPGYHTAKLIANDSVIRTVDVSIPTDRWFLYAKNITPGSTPAYIGSYEIMKDGILTVNEHALAASRINLTEEKQFVYTFFPSAIETGSDNLILKTRLRVREVRNNFCPYVMIEIFCQKYFMFFKSTSKGCAAESMLQFGEKFIDGKKADLSSLGIDVTQWLDAEVAIYNRQVSIKLNGQKVFSTAYTNSAGLITGVGFISNGLCEVDFVTLQGMDGGVIYQDDFLTK